ncbi:MAG: membrane protein insertase YidC [Flammeovirgaceae bacterium]
MGGMDKNQAIGFVLLSTLLLVYLLFFSPEPPQQPINQQVVNSDSLKNNQMLTNSTPSFSDSLLQSQYGIFASAFRGEEKEYVLENENITVVFSSKGAYPKKVLLKNYVTFQKKPLILFDEFSSQMNESILTTFGLIDLNKLYYKAHIQNNKIVFTAMSDSTIFLSRSYTLNQNSFLLSYSIDYSPIKNYLKNNVISFNWTDNVRQNEKDLQMCKTNTTVNFRLADETFDYLDETSSETETASLSVPAKFISFKEKFFNASLITDSLFHNVLVKSDVNTADPLYVKKLEMKLDLPLTSLSEKGNVRYYFGPNDYQICKTISPDFERNVYLGWKLFGAINKYTIVPLFQFLENFSSNYGVIIIILVFIIRTAMFPLSYKSYVSMAKMKVLKPELDELRAKYGDDMAKMQQETMKLYTQVGANPLSGCFPILAQIPVFLALFNFFPNAIELRQQGFLWADDLSSYDTIMSLPFSIPAYGSHVSLLTILMTASQLFLTYINNKYTPATTPQAEQMKIMGYIMPLVFLFFLNSFASGLTLYYFVSNIISILQMQIIRKFVDDEKIRKILDDNKKKNIASGKKSFIERMEDVRRAQEEAKLLKAQKNNKNEVTETKNNDKKKK